MMSTDPLIDVEQLLAPISEELPTGEELTLTDFDGPLMRIKDAWDEARKLVEEELDRELSGGLDGLGQPWRTIPPADWDAVIDRATETLASKSKDFRVAAWLTEGLLRKYQLPGLRDGLKLCLGLCQNYWDNIHPAPNEDGHLSTVKPIKDLVGKNTFPAVLATVIVAGKKPNEREERQYTAHDYLRAKELETLKDSDERERRLSDGGVEMAEFMAVAAVTSSELHSQNQQILDECLELLGDLESFLRDNCLDDVDGEVTSPTCSSFREQLELVRRMSVELAGGESSEADSAAEGPDSQDAGTGPVAQQQMTRDSAFQTVERIAQFFEKTEPHTPVHFALRQAVRWGRMPLHKLLAELIEDGGTMESLRKRIGLPQPENPEEY